MTKVDIQAERLDEAEELLISAAGQLADKTALGSEREARLLVRINRWLRKREEDTQ